MKRFLIGALLACTFCGFFGCGPNVDQRKRDEVVNWVVGWGPRDRALWERQVKALETIAASLDIHKALMEGYADAR